MHDDQHGTAIITAAGLLNAVKLTGKKIEDLKIVVNGGAGASAISCTRLYIKLGVRPENIVMIDSKGVLRKDRTDLNYVKQQIRLIEIFIHLKRQSKVPICFLAFRQQAR